RQRLAFSVVVFSCSYGSDDVIGFPLLNVCKQSLAAHQATVSRIGNMEPNRSRRNGATSGSA
ncbi:hypothetical protein NLI94_08235, partial [Acidithiobacillus ferrivorans]|uniref:hypothetical protein n=1 Tax=Acidithiobacillus ferrivorans TaxID=160808 RepID=UPI0040580633